MRKRLAARAMRAIAVSRSPEREHDLVVVELVRLAERGHLSRSRTPRLGLDLRLPPTSEMADANRSETSGE
jgi:hypothetical protein